MTDSLRHVFGFFALSMNGALSWIYRLCGIHFIFILGQMYNWEAAPASGTMWSDHKSLSPLTTVSRISSSTPILSFLIAIANACFMDKFHCAVCRDCSVDCGVLRLPSVCPVGSLCARLEIPVQCFNTRFGAGSSVLVVLMCCRECQAAN